MGVVLDVLLRRQHFEPIWVGTAKAVRAGPPNFFHQGILWWSLAAGKVYCKQWMCACVGARTAFR